MKPLIILNPAHVPEGIDIEEMAGTLQANGYDVLWSMSPADAVVRHEAPSQRERITTALLAAKVAAGAVGNLAWAEECAQAALRADALIKELNK